MKNSKKCCRNSFCSSFSEKEFMQDNFGKVVDSEVRDYLMMVQVRLLWGRLLAVKPGKLQFYSVIYELLRQLTFVADAEIRGKSELMKVYTLK